MTTQFQNFLVENLLQRSGAKFIYDRLNSIGGVKLQKLAKVTEKRLSLASLQIGPNEKKYFRGVNERELRATSD